VLHEKHLASGLHRGDEEEILESYVTILLAIFLMYHHRRRRRRRRRFRHPPPQVREKLILGIHEILKSHQTSFASDIERIQVVADCSSSNHAVLRSS